MKARSNLAFSFLKIRENYLIIRVLMSKLQISIVLPAHNEAENLPKLLKDVANCMKNLAWDYEVIVVNDGSTDNTKDILAQLKQTDSKIKEIYHPKNRGYGAALRSGFAAATKEWIFFTDSDRQFDIKEITKLASFSQDFDLVIGYRINRQDNWMRLLNARIYHLAIRILFGLCVKDIDCAFKLIKREVIQKINLESDGAFISSELLIKMKWIHARIKEIPVSHYPRIAGNSTGANLKVILIAMKEVVIFRLTGKLM